MIGSLARAFWDTLAPQWSLIQAYVVLPWIVPIYPPAVSVIGLLCLATGILAGVLNRSAAIGWFLLPLAVIHLAVQNIAVWRLGTERFPEIVLSASAVLLLISVGISVYRSRANAAAAVSLTIFILTYAVSAYYLLSFIVSFTRR